MKNYTFSIQKLAYFLIVLCLLSYIIIIGKSILAPLVFGTIFAFMLQPLCEKFEKYISYRPLSIAFSFIVALIPIALLIYLFSMQFIDVFQNMDSISEKIKNGVQDIFNLINTQLGISRIEGEAIISENTSTIVQTPLSYVGATLSLSSNFLVNFFLTIIYTFLILLYRTSFKQFYLIQFGDRIKDGAEEVLKKIQTVIQKYLYGLGLVIIILSVLNSIGLSIIGIDYAIFWGCLAAFLAIIPYIGTALGGLLPFLYAFATTDNYWQPLSVIALFTFVQVIEGNLITPKVVGSSIKINPLVAIVSLLLGGSIWGMAGLILSLPIIAIVRIIFTQIDFLKPIAILLGDEIYNKDEVFEKKFDKEKFRIFNFFKKKKPN
ncbi:MAG: AI-2E family transporter [Saprospiraceae bacterium]